MTIASNQTPEFTFTRHSPALILAGIILVVTLVRLYVAGSGLLSGDEAYYWLWSRRLQLSYFDHPGMMAWGMAASTWVFGTSELAIRLPTVLSSAVVSLLIYDSAKTAFDDARTGLGDRDPDEVPNVQGAVRLPLPQHRTRGFGHDVPVRSAAAADVGRPGAAAVLPVI